MKLPAWLFYPGDWRKDPGVQSLSYHDRGVWHELLLLMFESSDRGKLLLNGKAFPEDSLGRLLGLDKQSLTMTITTLLASGVASRDPETGALINRRMVRDEEIRKVRVECGKMGGNPNLLNQKSTTQDNQNPTTQDNQKTTLSSSSSFSTTEIKEKEETTPNFSEDSDEFFLSKLLFKKIQERDLKAKAPDLQKWAKHIDLLIRIDKRTVDEVETVIGWCQEDLFWQNNILSTEKLRKQFGQLKLKMDKSVPFQGLQEFLEDGNGGKRPAQICGPDGDFENSVQRTAHGQDDRKRPG